MLIGLSLVPAACTNPAAIVTVVPQEPAEIIPGPSDSLNFSPITVTTQPSGMPGHVHVPATATYAAEASSVPVPGLYEVWLWGNEYRPSTLVVPAGTTITWVGKDAEGHDVESDIPGLFLTSVPPGTSFNWTFDQPGIYGYHCCCGLLNGQIIVQ